MPIVMGRRPITLVIGKAIHSPASQAMQCYVEYCIGLSDGAPGPITIVLRRAMHSTASQAMLVYA